MSESRQFEITVRIGSPVPLDNDEWECAVAVDGLHENLRPQQEIDSWQALMLAQNLSRVLLQYFAEDGGTLRGKDSNDPIDLGEFSVKVAASNSLGSMEVEMPASDSLASAPQSRRSRRRLWVDQKNFSVLPGQRRGTAAPGHERAFEFEFVN